ncbi:hypothetical protein T439DRAFT_325339 [Meredithblackwellia eburnea MCA 4105]
MIKGPQTTQNLHAALHALPTPLPPRLPPSSFLRGARRVQEARSQGIPPSQLASSSKSWPGKEESSDGKWSMAYLKKVVLAGMEQRGDLRKVTRRKWESLLGESAAIKEHKEEVIQASGEKGKKKVQREEDAHVWVPKEMWDERFGKHLEKTGVEKANHTRSEVRAKVESKEDNKLREEFGLA